MVTTRWY